VRREFVGLDPAAGQMADGLWLPPVQLAALVAGLKAGESMIGRLDLVGAKSAGLSIEVVARGSSKRAAAERRALLGGLLDAALASALPLSTFAHSRDPKPKYACHIAALLVPEGLVLPLGLPPTQASSANPSSLSHAGA